MRIVNKQEFLAMPYGTLFSHYQPVLIEGLMVKHRNFYIENKPKDFLMENLIGNVECIGYEDYGATVIDSHEKGGSFKLDFNCTNRHGSFDDDALYAVYEKEDIEEFIKKLEYCKSVLKD